MPFPLNFSGEKFSSQTARLHCVLSYSTEINTIDIDVCNDHTGVWKYREQTEIQHKEQLNKS